MFNTFEERYEESDFMVLNHYLPLPEKNSVTQVIFKTSTQDKIPTNKAYLSVESINTKKYKKYRSYANVPLTGGISPIFISTKSQKNDSSKKEIDKITRRFDGSGNLFIPLMNSNGNSIELGLLTSRLANSIGGVKTRIACTGKVKKNGDIERIDCLLEKGSAANNSSYNIEYLFIAEEQLEEAKIAKSAFGWKFDIIGIKNNCQLKEILQNIKTRENNKKDSLIEMLYEKYETEELNEKYTETNTEKISKYIEGMLTLLDNQIYTLENVSRDIDTEKIKRLIFCNIYTIRKILFFANPTKQENYIQALLKLTLRTTHFFESEIITEAFTFLFSNPDFEIEILHIVKILHQGFLILLDGKDKTMNFNLKQKNILKIILREVFKRYKAIISDTGLFTKDDLTAHYNAIATILEKENISDAQRKRQKESFNKELLIICNVKRESLLFTINDVIKFIDKKKVTVSLFFITLTFFLGKQLKNNWNHKDTNIWEKYFYLSIISFLSTIYFTLKVNQNIKEIVNER